MHILVIAGVLALVGAQSTIDPSVLVDIFGKPPSTSQPLEEVPRHTRLVKVDGLPTISPSLLTEVFGTPPTPKFTRETHKESPKRVTQGSRDVNVQGVPTVKPSLLTEVFGTPATNSSNQRLEDANSRGVTQGTRAQSLPTVKPSLLKEVFGTPPTPDTSPKRVTQGSRDVNVQGVPTIKPSLLTEVFGTPATNSSKQRLEDANSRGVPQGTRAQSLPTVKPSLLKEVFGTPPTPDSSGRRDEDSSQGNQGTRNVNVDGLPTVDPSIIIDIFGTPPTITNSTKGFEEITVKPTEGTSTFTDKNGGKCQCVPYYLCDSNNVGVDVYNSSITGAGLLDIRFGDSDSDNARQCQESVEVCCIIPEGASEPPTPPTPVPTPKPARGCGYRNPKGLGVTITGGTGTESQFGEFPWVVALLNKQNSSYIGVGVLINPKVVMTGAHVVQRYGPGELKIRAGEWDTQTLKEIYPYEERDVQDTVIHQNFMPKSLKNDIALLLLDSPLEISEHINVICMPEQDEVFDSSKSCVANGWGKTHFGQSNRYAVILKRVEIDMVPYTRCNTLLKRTRLGNNFKLHNSFVCAGGEAGKDTCQGDGGAPLACPIGNNRYKLTGLVAWGIGCGQQDVPAVYTNVPLFRDWVDDKMAEWGLAATSYRISDSE